MLELTATVLSLVGAVLNVLKNRWGFALWIVSNGGWIAFGVVNRHWGVVVTFTVYLVISTWGFFAWKEKRQ